MFALTETVVDQDDDFQAALDQHALQIVALVVQDVEGHGCAKAKIYRAGTVLAGLYVHRPKGHQGGALGGADAAGTLAVRADLGGTLDDAETAALAADLHQAEARDTAHLDTGAVLGEGVLQGLFDGAVVLRLIHVDEVDDDQAGEVAQTQLASGLNGGLHIGLGGSGLDVAFLGGATRIHVDGDQRLGLVDHQIAAGVQGHDRLMDLGQHLLDPVGREQRPGSLVEMHLLRLRRHEHAHEVARLHEALDALDLDAVEILVEHVADGAADEVFLLIDDRGRVRLQRRFADRFPKAQQIFVVALDLGLGALGTGGADDQPHTLGNVQGCCRGLQTLAVRGLGDLA